jgi:hypothetical protein
MHMTQYIITYLGGDQPSSGPCGKFGNRFYSFGVPAAAQDRRCSTPTASVLQQRQVRRRDERCERIFRMAH